MSRGAGVVFCICMAACSRSHSPVEATGASPQATQSPDAVVLNGNLGGRQLFPPDNWWNQDVRSAPIDPQSDQYIDVIGRTSRVHPDFGPPPYGIPYISVGAAQPRIPVIFTDYGDESDQGYGREAGYPIPLEARTQPNFIEGATPGGSRGDSHMLIVDRSRWVLFELYSARWNVGASRWEAASGAVFDLNVNARRPDGWTSADAAGLPILPGLVRYDEVSSGREIGHAFRVTVQRTNGYIWPASHRAGNAQGGLPMGARLRLKASKNLAGYPPELQRVFRAMQRYGLIVADNGSNMFVTGTMDPQWNNDILNPAFHSLNAGDFEVVQLGWRQ